MRASTIPLAITLTLAPLPALPFDQDEFCVAVSDIVRHTNARKGRWLDRSTRHDGVELDCDAKTLEAKRFVNADAGGLGSAQREAVERCLLQRSFLARGDRQRLEHHLHAIVSDGAQVSFVAEC